MKWTSARVTAAALCALAVGACSTDRLTVPNYNNPTPDAISSQISTGLPALAAGVLRNDRDNFPGYISGVGILGRETYNYTPTENRNTTGWLTNDVNLSTSFGSGALWAGPYTELRNIASLLAVVEAATDAQLPAAQKQAARGFAHTMEALTLYYVIVTRDSIGAPVNVDADASVLVPFATRDSVYRYISARLDQARTELAAGGASFPFPLHAGFAGFNTPTTFVRFNRAIAARVNAYRASMGTGGCTVRSATCYQQVLTNLSESFLDPAGSLTAGPFRPYSSAANDVALGISNEASQFVVLHAKTDSGVVNKADGTRDNRWTTKVQRLTAPRRPSNATIGVGTEFDFTTYATRNSPVSIIRNEELLLLRAEARYFSGDAAGALADINLIRTSSGGLAPTTAFASADAFIDELLYNRRWSLLFEGHRWADVRRFGRLNTLTRDLPNQIVVSRLVVPQAECLARRIAGGTALPAVGCSG
jgi:hypothetical protein